MVKGAKLVLLSKTKRNLATDFTEIFWSYHELDNFIDLQTPGRILEIVCGDFDNDGVDEIIVSVTGSGQDFSLSA